MALIAMCCHDTADNKRTEFTIKTVESLFRTVDFSKHRLFIFDNASCEETKAFLKTVNATIFTSETNIGTARAINKCWSHRRDDECVIKIDNDVVIHNSGWVDEMEEAVSRDARMGIVGLKRKDLEQKPDHPNPWYRSHLILLPHSLGQRWVIIEATSDIMGTCVMASPGLFSKIGYLYQPGVYGWDDVDFSVRSAKAGFINCFLPHIEIEHIDPGGSAYNGWKQKTAGDSGAEVNQVLNGYRNGTIPLYRPLN